MQVLRSAVRPPALRAHYNGLDEVSTTTCLRAYGVYIIPAVSVTDIIAVTLSYITVIYQSFTRHAKTAEIYWHKIFTSSRQLCNTSIC